MPYLLDTNICIARIKQQPANLLNRLTQCQPGQVYVSAISVAELRYGSQKSKAAAKNDFALDCFLAPLEILSFDERCCTAYGAIRAELERAGTPIGPLDTLIASQAVAYSMTLVSNNEREFERVRQLIELENWIAT